MSRKTTSGSRGKPKRGRGAGRAKKKGARGTLPIATAGVGLVVGILVGSAWWGWRQARPPLEAETAERYGSMAALPGQQAEVRIRVEVLNGAGRSGAAEQAATLLRRAGFDVVYYGNAETFGHPRTRVVDRSDREGLAAAVAAWLEVDSLERAPDPTLHLDATVILGDDWQERFRLD